MIYYYLLKHIFALGFIICAVLLLRNKFASDSSRSKTILGAIGFLLLSVVFWILDLTY